MVDQEPSFLKEDGADFSAASDLEGPAKTRRAAVKDRPVVYVAGFWRRFAAIMVDTAVALPVAALLCLLVGKIAGIALPHARHAGVDYWLDLALAGDPALWGGLTLILCILLIYMMVFQATMGHTLGMRLLGIRVIDLFGQSPGLMRSAIRTLGYVIGLLSGSLGFLWIAVDREKRGIHDWLAGTYVIKTSR